MPDMATVGACLQQPLASFAECSKQFPPRCLPWSWLPLGILIDRVQIRRKLGIGALLLGGTLRSSELSPDSDLIGLDEILKLPDSVMQ